MFVDRNDAFDRGGYFKTFRSVYLFAYKPTLSINSDLEYIFGLRKKSQLRVNN